MDREKILEKIFFSFILLGVFTMVMFALAISKHIYISKNLEVKSPKNICLNFDRLKTVFSEINKNTEKEKGE